jgi:hypothetical protein
MASLKETESADRNSWEREGRARLDEEWRSREEAIKSAYERERDDAIKKATDKMEADLSKVKNELEEEITQKEKCDTSFYLLWNKCSSINPLSVACGQSSRVI